MAGWVMPRVLMASADVAFMICQSCAGMAGTDQGAYRTVAQGYCGGVPEEDTRQLQTLLLELDEARTYATYPGYFRYREVLGDLAALTSVAVPQPVASEAAWLENDPDYEFSWSPVEVFERVRIPVLAIWGGRDTKVDPFQAAHAYRQALEQAGNPNYQLEVIPSADHNLAASETGCMTEEDQTIERVLAQQGLTFADLDALDPQDPLLLTLGSAFPYVPEYLDMIEEWLTSLQP
jgi:hypothetical protein